MSEKAGQNEEKYVFLIQAYNDVEADIIQGVLESCNVPSKRVHKSVSGLTKIIMGEALSVDIYVPSKYYCEAKNIIDNLDFEEGLNYPFEDERD